MTTKPNTMSKYAAASHHCRFVTAPSKEDQARFRERATTARIAIGRLAVFNSWTKSPREVDVEVNPWKCLRSVIDLRDADLEDYGYSEGRVQRLVRMFGES